MGKDVGIKDADVRTMSEDVRATSEDVRATSEDVRATSKDVRAMSKDVRATSKDVRATSKDVRATSEDVRATSDDKEVITATKKMNTKDVDTTENRESTHWVQLPATINVWPVPQKMSLSTDKFTLGLYSGFVIRTPSESPVLKGGIERYQSILQSISKNHSESECGNNTVKMIKIDVDGDDETLSLNTSYKYSVTVDVATGVVIHAENPFGAL